MPEKVEKFGEITSTDNISRTSEDATLWGENWQSYDLDGLSSCAEFRSGCSGSVYSVAGQKSVSQIPIQYCLFKSVVRYCSDRFTASTCWFPTVCKSIVYH
jgi:hypothetical protein